MKKIIILGLILISLSHLLIVYMGTNYQSGKNHISGPDPCYQGSVFF